LKNNKLKIFCLSILSIIIISACNEEPNEIGLSLQPENEKYDIEINDTSTITSYSLIEDSVRTDETSKSLLGSFYDPVFGKTTAGFYTQFHLSSLGINFGDEPVLDSIVLSLAYAGYFGDTTTTQTLKVYEVTEDINYDTSYYSNNVLQYDQNNPIANINFQPRPNDSVLIDTIKYPPQLNINLSNISPDFGNKILNASEDELTTNEKFNELLKGIYLCTDPVDVIGEGAILSFSLVSQYSKITLYYSNSENDSLKYTFNIDSYCGRFNNFNHNNYEDASQEFKNQVIEHDTILGDNIFYLQPLGGVKAKISFPFIKNWSESKNIVINKAQLVFHVNEEDLSINNYTPPAKLLLVKINDEGKYQSISDQSEGDSYYGGEYNSTDKEYSFTITRHIQSILNNNEINNDLYLLISGSSVNANRVLINGSIPISPAQASDALQLKLFYTKLN